ncbi:MAG: chemotaxis protein CheW [Pontibacterium sp.]
MNSPEDTFREEATELLADLETALLELEDQPDDGDPVDRAFRAMHTIKGSGAMFGFDKLSAFTHHLETAFDQVRSGELAVTKDLINVALGSGDHIRSLLEDMHPAPGLEAEGEHLLKQLSSLLPGNEDASGETPPLRPEETPDLQPETTYRIRFTPAPDAFSNGMDPLPVLRGLAALGTCHVITLCDEVPGLSGFEPETCYLSWALTLTTARDRNSIDDVFIFVQDDWAITVEMIDRDSGWSDVPDEKPVGEILIERGDATPKQIEAALAGQKRTGEILSEAGNVPPEKVQAALAEQQIVRKAHQARKAKDDKANVKVPAEKLDTLMNLVGELVIAQARLNQSADTLQDTELTSAAEEIERLTAELRDNTLGLRMLPIGTTFARFRRLVRDLSNDLGKEIELVTEGAETELDKTVIDRLGDPLVHLIRNCIDHGIEMPDVREAAGKPRKGTVHLSAVHSESHVNIEIRDDGAGLNAEAIFAKAVERGVMAEDASPSEEELYNLVFDAGFSTNKTVSSISGRGVGMDVVKRSIASLRGKVRIDSESGQGSTVTIELPLTLAIIEGLLVRVGDERYVLPLSLVEECIELTASDAERRRGNRLIEVRGELVPYLRLREWFGQQTEQLPIEQIVITRMGDTRFGFTVDQVIGQHQTVIKGLGKLYEGIKGLSGATILGDGTVALILDTPKLIQSVMAEDIVIH